MLDIKELLKNLPEDVDFATIEEMAKSLEDDPALRKAYEDNLGKEGFNETVEELADKIKDLFNHKDSK
jgi:hypothetical protein